MIKAITKIKRKQKLILHLFYVMHNSNYSLHITNNNNSQCFKLKIMYYLFCRNKRAKL